MSIELKITDRSNVKFPIVIKDNRGNEIYKQFENGDWWEATFDDNGNQLTYKDSNNFWWQRTYDDNNHELTYKNSNGHYLIKGGYATKEEYESFINSIPEYTMEELVSILGNFKIKK